MSLENKLNKNSMYNYILKNKNIGDGDFSNISDPESFYPSLNDNLAWEIEVNKYLSKNNFNVPKIITDFPQTINSENPILVMEKLYALPFQDIIDNKLEKSMDSYDLFLSTKYNLFLKTYYNNKEKIIEKGLNPEDSVPFHNTMYSENPIDIYYFDFVGWTPNKNILNYIDLNFKKEFPMLYDYCKIKNFI